MSAAVPTRSPSVYQRRVDRADWAAVAAEMDELGCAVTPPLLTATDTPRLVRLYDHDGAFRSTVTMGRHRFGEWLERCHAAGQTKPTPLLLEYGPGDWNALHRDLYGELVFPLQVVINLTRPEVDYTGGELVLVEQRPRAQSRATAISLPYGQGLVFTTRDRPVRSQRGWSASPVRHGVSVVRSGRRFTLGLLFHDAS